MTILELLGLPESQSGPLDTEMQPLTMVKFFFFFISYKSSIPDPENPKRPNF